MRTAGSLSFRLTALVALSVSTIYLLTPVALFYLEPDSLPNSEKLAGGYSGALHLLALVKPQNLVTAALRRDATGALAIERTPELRAYVSANPGFRYAVLGGPQCHPAAGSDPDVVAAIKKIGDCPLGYGPFALGDAPTPRPWSFYSSYYNVPVGSVALALYGYRFHWEDVVYYVHDQLHTTPWRFFGPTFVALILVSALSVLRGLAPLRRAARRLEAIDMNALDSRLAVDDLPSEVTPFVQAVNRMLERVERGVGQQKRFLANAAHELRTPLAVLRARVEASEDSALKGHLKRDVTRIGAIMEQLLASARLGASGADVAQRIDLADLAWRVVADYALLCLGRDRRIEFEERDEPVFIQGDRRAVESVVANLIDNALRAERAGGTVLVRVQDDGVLAVIDHGEGVQPEDRETIFEPFWRKSDATPGTGLGLAIARDLISKLSGRIWVEDTPGGGATFKIAFRASPDE
ncbi:MAG: HAMP domain-containing sensor histidine kinase [Methylocystis sp.]